MKHFNIQAKKDDVTEIDIFGQIGESFFEEGNTLESVKAEIDNIKGKIVVNISSLGGNALEGLAIHDLLASKDVTINIVGATASAAAVISAAGKRITSTSNSLYLPHNSRTMTAGTADELESMVADLRKVDSRMTAIFVAKTGKTEQEVKDLLAKDEFMTAQEAFDFGFIDEVIESEKIAASVVDMKKVMASKELTEAQKDQLKSIKTKSKNIMDLTPITDAISALTDKVTALVTPESTTEETTVEIKVLDNEEVTAKIEEITASLTTLGDTNTTLEAKVAELETEKTDLETELAKHSQTETETETGDEPAPVEGDDTVDASVLGNAILASFKDRHNV